MQRKTRQNPGGLSTRRVMLLAASFALAASMPVRGDQNGAATNRIASPPAAPAAAAHAPGASDISTLKLRPSVTVSATPTLLDVLDFSRADAQLAERIGPQPVFREPPSGAGPLSLPYTAIQKRLEELGVNRARVLLNGAATCTIRIESPRKHEGRQTASAAGASPATDAIPAAPLFRADAADQAGGASGSLAAAIQAYVDRQVSKLGGRAILTFEKAGSDFLSLTSPGWEFVINGGGDPLGLREFVVTLRHDGKVQRTVRIFAQVQLRRTVVVTRRAISLGVFVKPDDVATEERILSRGEELGFHDVEMVVGQQARRFVPAGQMLARGDLKAVDLVQRSRPVTVVGLARGVQLRLSGTALDSGSYGELVRVRVGESRADRRELRGSVTGPGTVQIAEDGI